MYPRIPSNGRHSGCSIINILLVSKPAMGFTPLHTLFGGSLLSLASSSLLSGTGRVFGISSIAAESLWGDRASWRFATIAGLLAGPLVGYALGVSGQYASDAVIGWSAIPLGRAVIAGLLVGFGSRLGSGCTSGHMLCGVARGSKRSFIATATFFSTAVLTANLVPLGTRTKIAATSPFTPQKGLPDPPIFLLPTALATLLSMHYLFPQISSHDRPAALVKLAPYFLSGLVFSLGLLTSGMADPSKVLNFLVPLSPSFDPSLAMVVISGLIPNALYWMTTQKGRVAYPWEQWRVPSRTNVDWRLICGAAIFGIGWGSAGVCPGPAIVGVGRLVQAKLVGESIVAGPVLGFMGSMLVGMGIGGVV